MFAYFKLLAWCQVFYYLKWTLWFVCYVNTIQRPHTRTLMWGERISIANCYYTTLWVIRRFYRSLLLRYVLNQSFCHAKNLKNLFSCYYFVKCVFSTNKTHFLGHYICNLKLFNVSWMCKYKYYLKYCT